MVDVSPTAGMVVGPSTDRDPYRLFLDVCAANGMRSDVVIGPRRDKGVVVVRRAAARALREAGCSLPEIGRLLGGRHHTTVMNLLDPDVARRKYLATIGATQRTWRDA